MVIIFSIIFDIRIKFTFSTITKRWRNNNISLDVCYETTLREKNSNRKTLTKHKIQGLPPFSKFVTEILIFRTGRSEIFFKIGGLKISQSLLLQNTCSGCFWIFATANAFFQLNLVFITESRTGFCCELPWKQELNLRSIHWNSYVKKGVLRNFARKKLCRSLFLIRLLSFSPAALLKRDSNTDVFLWNLPNF